MTAVEFEDGTFEVDAAVVAEGLGIALPQLKQQMQAGKITTLSERGIGADRGRHRLTFFSETRRLRLVIDEHGRIIQRTTVDFGSSRLPGSARKPGR
jgi:hypothetical protein